MKQNKTALIVGATGLIGAELLQLLLHDDTYGKVVSFVRRSSNINHPKLQEQVIDLSHLSTHPLAFQADEAFCCLGTTMRQAGSKEAFYQVDFTFVKLFAELALRFGARRFFLITALGANRTSLAYYNRVKGEIEEVITKKPFASIHIFRPSLLLGKRKDERFGEKIGVWIDRLIGWALPLRYQAIEGKTVAKAMLLSAKNSTEGIFFHESEKIRQIADNN